MNPKLLALACLALGAVTACQQPAEPAAPADVTPATAAAAPMAVAPAPAPVAVESAPAASAADVPFDTKGFAGSFRGTLPCADCPGIDTVLALNGDGTFRLDETYQDRKDGNAGIEGTWTTENDDRHVRLDPNSKREHDRLYEIVSKQEIRMLDRQGQPIGSAQPYSLRRDAATQ